MKPGNALSRFSLTVPREVLCLLFSVTRGRPCMGWWLLSPDTEYW